MTEIMRSTIERVTPVKRLSEMYMIDVQDTVFDVFSKIGYLPSVNIDKSIDKVWANSSRDDLLSEFVYNVWRNDNG